MRQTGCRCNVWHLNSSSTNNTPISALKLLIVFLFLEGYARGWDKSFSSPFSVYLHIWFSSYRRLTNLLLSHLLSPEILERNQWERLAGEYALVCVHWRHNRFCICIYSRTRLSTLDFHYTYKVLPKRCHVVARWLEFSAWLRAMSWPHSVEIRRGESSLSREIWQIDRDILRMTVSCRECRYNCEILILSRAAPRGYPTEGGGDGNSFREMHFYASRDKLLIFKSDIN